MKSKEYDFLYKIIFVGDSNAGKTSFITKFTKRNNSLQKGNTIGLEYASKCVLLKDNNGIAKAQIWDTSGSERYKSVTTSHFRKSAGAMLFFDLTSQDSFNALQGWYQNIIDSAEHYTIVLLIANKLDLFDQRKVQQFQIDLFIQKHNMLYFETSAKTGLNVQESFEFLIEAIYIQQKSIIGRQENSTLKLKSILTTYSQKCC